MTQGSRVAAPTSAGEETGDVIRKNTRCSYLRERSEVHTCFRELISVFAASAGVIVWVRPPTSRRARPGFHHQALMVFKRRRETHHLGDQVVHRTRTEKAHAHEDLALEDADDLDDACSTIRLPQRSASTPKTSYCENALTLCAYRNDLPSPTAFAPRQTALRTSLPRVIPPSMYISILSNRSGRCCRIL